jgi:NAD(P)H dehydrogenase (quinone)
MSTPDLLVTGASGKLGSRVLHHLLTTLNIPASRIAAASRKPDSLAERAAQGITVRAADFDDAASLDKAFVSIDRLLVISTDTLDKPGHRLAQHKAAIDAAVKQGVRHLIYSSMPKPETSAVLFAPDHAGTEAYLAASALPDWTVLRNNWYFENLFFSLPAALSSGSWYSAAGEGKIAHIARDDLARAAATALSGATSGKTTLTLSGANGYSTAEIAALVSQTVGKPIAVVPVPVEALVQGMTSHGVPEPIARVFASFDVNTAQGGLADVTGDYAKLTGVQPQSFESWLADNKAVLATL